MIVGRSTSDFLAPYGSGLAGLVAGEFRDGTRLANGGETPRFLSADREVIHEVSYGDTAPWPEEPDGGGVSCRRVVGLLAPVVVT
ncbi:MAG: hypothetical protein P8J87_05015 [Verrucomicrobiales bacterium]|nr:hypothetical protein [Verrucomicrobiales bacterium]